MTFTTSGQETEQALFLQFGAHMGHCVQCDTMMLTSGGKLMSSELGIPHDAIN